ncbi:MAG: WD40/YVTN/BNR-like repeat-containing protein [Solirubrobacteraceae bacterium]
MLIAVLGGCGDEAAGGGAPASERPPSDRLVDFSKDPPYVNTFDVDPATGDYLLTTNRGFWRIDPATDEVTQMRGTITAGRRSSTVGTFLELHVTGPGRLLGSGHPDSEDDGLPPFLGLIASDDGGESWRAVSRLGDADLHKIVLKHDRMYAFDAVLGALLVSTDGGRTFTEHFTPRQLVIDFEVDPHDPERIFASTDEELLRSEDGGEGWRAVDRAEGIRLAWPAPDAFYRAERDGSVARSRDGGDSWEPVGSVPGEPYEFRAQGPEELLLALSDGTVVETRDGGRSWTEAFQP